MFHFNCAKLFLCWSTIVSKINFDCYQFIKKSKSWPKKVIFRQLSSLILHPNFSIRQLSYDSANPLATSITKNEKKEVVCFGVLFFICVEFYLSRRKMFSKGSVQSSSGVLSLSSNCPWRTDSVLQNRWWLVYYISAVGQRSGGPQVAGWKFSIVHIFWHVFRY